MRKFIVSICAVLVVAEAFGRSATGIDPTTVSTTTILSNWKASTNSGDYTTDMVNIFAPQWQFNTKAGTYGTNSEGSIVGNIARNIYEHGATFCATQIQSAWHGSKDWIDYYEPNKTTKCETICMPGYSGNECEIQSTNCDKLDKNYNQDIYNAINDGATLRKLSGKDAGVLTPGIRVFAYANDYSKEKSYAIVLGVIEQRKHSVFVAPILVNAKGDKITSAYSNGERILLCAPGYVANSTNTDCELAFECKTENRPCENVNVEEFDETQHVWEYRRIGNTTCRYFVCAEEGYGFVADDSTSCAVCKRELRQGINDDGVCEECKEQNKIFLNGKCRTATGYSKLKMQKGQNENQDRKCWMETDKFDFAECVLCSATDTWKDHKCQ